MSNIAYDRLKWIALIFLPALGTFYYAIALIWNLPYAEEVVATITAIDTFLGALVKYSADKYYSQVMVGEDIEEDYEEGEEDGEEL